MKAWPLVGVGAPDLRYHGGMPCVAGDALNVEFSKLRPPLWPPNVRILVLEPMIFSSPSHVMTRICTEEIIFGNML